MAEYSTVEIRCHLAKIGVVLPLETKRHLISFNSAQQPIRTFSAGPAINVSRV